MAIAVRSSSPNKLECCDAIIRDFFALLRKIYVVKKLIIGAKLTKKPQNV